MTGLCLVEIEIYYLGFAIKFILAPAFTLSIEV